MKNLTPVSTFTTPVRAPEDVLDNVTGVTVEEGLQALTNRTEYLRDGSVRGPTTATDNAIARFDGTTGRLVQDSEGVTVGDDDVVTAAGFTFAPAKEPWFPVPITEFVSGDPISYTESSSALSSISSTVLGQEIYAGIQIPPGSSLIAVEAVVALGTSTTMAVTETVADFATPAAGSVYTLGTDTESAGSPKLLAISGITGVSSTDGARALYVRFTGTGYTIFAVRGRYTRTVIN